jgi:hypothetical protein
MNTEEHSCISTFELSEGIQLRCSCGWSTKRGAIIAAITAYGDHRVEVREEPLDDRILHD